MLDKSYQLLNKGAIRGRVLIRALAMAFCVMWDPSRFAAKTSSLAIWQGIILIWPVCAAAVFGLAYRPKHVVAQYLLHPIPAIIILVVGLYYFFF